jgi:ribosomal protein S18 acetylase RimI-like enzyme
MTDGLVPLQPGDRNAVRDVARLHQALLPGSPIPRLGRRFMERFYYRTLVEDGLLAAHLYYVEGRAAGFITLTAVPSRFMAEGLRRHWWGLAGILLWELLADPRRIAVIVWTLRHMGRQGVAPAEPGEGEILSFGVLPEFRTPAFVRRSGRRIAGELFDRAVASLQADGTHRIRAVVETRNREALMFYHARGCQVRAGAESVPGTVLLDCLPPAAMPG